VEWFLQKHARRNFCLALGRICPEKGYHLALGAAQRAGVPLLLAGEVFGYPSHQEYFQSEIVPRLNGMRRFIGPAGFARKRRLLSAARCLLIPSLAAETSSLVAMESLACGTPVVAFHAGALEEIIEHGKTGFLVSDEQEMGAAILDVEKLDPEVCRMVARREFSSERMIARYLDLYARLVRGGEPEQAGDAL
jgi:glycosyltransferase involved in cell wall biosynthesis